MRLIGHWAIIAAISAAMLVVHLVDVMLQGLLIGFGIQPRDADTAYTIFTAPWIHADLGHLGSNLAGFVVLAALTLLNGIRYFLKASLLIIVIGGALVWVLGREATHIGASGWVFGLWSLVIARAWYHRSARDIAIALAIVFLYGGMVWGVLPTQRYISFESHLFGAVAGVFAASLLSRKSIEIAAPTRANQLKF